MVNFIFDCGLRCFEHSVVSRRGFSGLWLIGLWERSSASQRIKLMCGRFALIHTLFGGVSFKLTPEARKKAMDEYHKQLKMEEDAKFDVFYFNETIRDPTDEDLNAIAEFLAGTKQRDVVSMAYAVFNRLPPEKAKPLKARLANARIEELRLLAGS